MPSSIRHKKTNTIADWTQAQLDNIINGGSPPNLPAGTVLNDIVLPTDWNDTHEITDLLNNPTPVSFLDWDDGTQQLTVTPVDLNSVDVINRLGLANLDGGAAGTVLAGQSDGANAAYVYDPVLGVPGPGAGITEGSLSIVSAGGGLVRLRSSAIIGNNFDYWLPFEPGAAGDFLRSAGDGEPQTWGPLLDTDVIAALSYTPGTGDGSVTSVSVAAANGVSGSVANATTTPEISLTLGNITPTQVAASGTVTGSNLSGTNTGDQTISLTGDVTGSGTGSFAATIANNVVTNAKLRQSDALSVIGNGTNATANVTDISAGTDGQVLRRAGTSLAFGAIDLGNSDAVSGALPLGNISSLTEAVLLGNPYTSTPWIPTEIALGATLYFDTSFAPTLKTAAFTGDVTTAAGSFATSIGAGKVTNAMLAGGIDVATKIAGVVGLSNGGSNAALSASNGGIVYSDASAMAILSGTPTAGKILQSGASTAPSWSTPTYPSASGSVGKILRADGTNNVYSTATFADTYAASNLLYSNGANAVTGLATANNGVLITSGTGVPSISSTLPNAVQDNITRLGNIANVGAAFGVGIGGTGTSTAFTAGSVVFAGASGGYSQDATKFFYDSTNRRLGVGTNSPQRTLHIEDATSSYLRIAGSAGAQQAIEWYDTATRWVLYKPASSTSLRFYDGTADRMSLLAGGGLAIGATALNNSAVGLQVGNASTTTLYIALDGGATAEKSLLYYSAGTGKFAVGLPSSSSTYTVSDFGTGDARLQIDSNGNVVIGKGALATTATDGFLYIPTCAGAPTGVPTAFTGRVAFRYDSTNNKLYVYNGAWKSATFT